MSYTSDNISLIRANTDISIFNSGDVNENTIEAYSNLFFPFILDNGGNNKNISLTIDVLNKDELKKETKDLTNKNWINKDRLNGNLSLSQAIWGFKEAFHGVKKSRAISNAICFGGQEITFYIAQQGHGTGYVNDQWIYCRTEIIINAIDVANGTSEILYTFDGFEKDKSDSSRYFNWTIPSINNSTFTDYGMFGLVVLRIDISQTYYKDSKLETEIEEVVPSTNQAHLQLLIYSGAKEIIEVNAGDLNILNSTPSYDETLEEIFDNTIFSDIENLNKNPLTDAQKRSIIADQIAALFISQHPVITANYYPGKVIGFGANESIPPRKVIEKAIIYSKRYPDIIPVVNDRLFGMLATYKSFNFTFDIEKYIANYSQSSQLTRDPVRIINIDSDGNVRNDIGINGIIFNPYALEVYGTETITNQEDIFDITLQDGSVDIQNIQVLGRDGVTQIQPYEYYCTVKFDVVYGEDNIKYIRYSVFSQEGLNYNSYTDTAGLTRSYLFKLDNPLIPRPAKRGDIITAQIDIEDVDGGVTSFVYILPLDGYDESPSLYDLKIYQRDDGSGIVDIYYSYEGLGEINNSYLYVQFSEDNGVTWSNVPTTSLKGDYGSNVMPGRRRVTWKPIIDLEGFDSNNTILCRLTLYDVDGNSIKGHNVTGALVKDLVKPEIAVMRCQDGN